MSLARWGPAFAASAALALASTACKPAQGEEQAAEKKEAKAKFGSLTPDEVQKHIDLKDASIFDNNSKKVYAKGHLPTAKWVDYKALAADDLPQDKARMLVFYCANEG
jgi:hypothetical protein